MILKETTVSQEASSTPTHSIEYEPMSTSEANPPMVPFEKFFEIK